MIFATDIHDALVRARALRKAAAGSDGDRSLLVVGGDLTSFGGVGRARTVLTELGLAFRRIVAIPGNTDLPEVSTWLSRLGISIHGRADIIDGVGFIGCGGSNRTPMHTPNERDEDEIAACLEAGIQDLETQGGADRIVVVSHCPPRNTATDRLQGGLHVGSSALRAFLESRSLDLCLCGHIHESIGIDYVGRTMVCNPGALAWGHYASVRWEGQDPVCGLHTVPVNSVSGSIEAVVGAVRKLAGYATWRFDDLSGPGRGPDWRR